MNRKLIYVVLGAVAVLAVVGVLVWRSRPAAQPEEALRSAVVERGTMLVAVSASGSVEPEARVGLAFELGGRVAEVPVKVGDRVEAGDVLARLDARQLALQVQQAEASLALIEAQLAQLQAGPRPEEIAATEANLEAAQAQASAAAARRDRVEDGASEAQIASAEAQVASAKLQKEVAQDTYDAITEEDTGRSHRKEHANYNLYVAKEALAAAQAELDRLLSGADADEVRASRANVAVSVAQGDAAQAQLALLLAGATDEQIADVEAQVVQAEAAVELAKIAMRQTALLSPFDGVVAEVNVMAGEMASIGRPLVTVLDTSRFHVTVDVDEVDVGQLSVGRDVEVTLDALPDVVIDGTVKRIAPDAQTVSAAAGLEGGVVYYDVTIELDPTDAPIRADMTANAVIVVDELTGVLKIPTWVVRVDRDAGQTYVHKQVGDDFERVEVRLGVRYQGVAQVLDGLAEGDEVVWIPESGVFDFGGE